MTIGPSARISFGLVLMTISLLFAADFLLGISPDRVGPAIQMRKQLCESLAVQYSSLIARGDLATIESTMNALVQRDPQVLSAGLRTAGDGLLAQTPDHAIHWAGAPTQGSTITHAQVPILRDKAHWGTVEVRFAALDAGGLAGLWDNPLYRLIAFVATAGFVGFALFMRRTLRYLDPSSVVPGRVKAALDQLVEGVILLDDNQHIVLANAAFAEKVGQPAESLMGTRASRFEWRLPGNGEDGTRLPWEAVSEDGMRRTEVRIELDSPGLGLRTFSANFSPILDGRGKPRGILASFDDVTDLEDKNAELERSRDEVRRQNKRLQYLATRDTLTGCLNRRAFFERFESELGVARRDRLELSCIMLDIDNFKSVNDQHGHAVGDQVIRKMVEVLAVHLGPNDVIGRYGGEEFCVLLPGADQVQANTFAETARRDLAACTAPDLPLPAGYRVTASFGVSAIGLGAPGVSAMIDQADQALYLSKAGGRNRVTLWSEVTRDQAATG